MDVTDGIDPRAVGDPRENGRDLGRTRAEELGQHGPEYKEGGWDSLRARSCAARSRHAEPRQHPEAARRGRAENAALRPAARADGMRAVFLAVGAEQP